MHRQIQTGGGFTAAGYAEEDHLRLIEIAQRYAVIMGQGVFNGRDPGIILAQVVFGQSVGAIRYRRWIHR
ncbi:hypothetical protein D3C80_1525340 [compost metagenome]